MSNTIKWKVDALFVQSSDPAFPNDVIRVVWNVSATSPKGTVAETGGSTTVEPATQEDFVPYDQLTEDQVLGWVKEKLGDEQVKGIEANLDRSIEIQENPPPCPILKPLPWSPAR